MATALHSAGNVLISAGKSFKTLFGDIIPTLFTSHISIFLGADRKIIVWSIRPTSSSSADTPKTDRKPVRKSNSDKKNSKIAVNTSSAQVEETFELHEALAIHNKYKINAISGSRQDLQLMTNHIAVADTSAHISLYSLV